MKGYILHLPSTCVKIIATSLAHDVSKCNSGHEVNFMKAKAKSYHDEINLHLIAWGLMFHGIRSLCGK